MAIVTGSFLITFQIMDYIDISHKEAREAATKEIWPITWKKTGRASYETRNGTVIFRSPDYIFNQVDCGSLESNIAFSIFIERADEANMGLTFLNAQGGVVGEPLIQSIGGVTNRPAGLRSPTRRGAGKIQALIYSSLEIDTVLFKDAFMECKPLE